MNAQELAQIALLGEAAECLAEVAIFVWDEDRHYVAANDAALELTGRTREQILGMQVGDMSPDRAAPHFEEVLRGSVHHGRSQLNRDDGVVEIEWITTRTRIANLPYMISMCWRVES